MPFKILTNLRAVKCYNFKIKKDFILRITRLVDNVYQYKGYFLPIKHFEELFYYNHSLDVLDSQTLEKIKHKDIIDVGGFMMIVQLFFKNLHTKIFIPLRRQQQILNIF